jgi:exosortase/archaeosortase family protein
VTTGREPRNAGGRRVARILVAFLLLFFAVVAYLLFVPDETNLLLVPASVAFLVVGLYLLTSSVGALRAFKPAIPFIGVFILVEFLLSSSSLTAYIYGTYYAQALTTLTAKLAVWVLNALGVHATLAQGLILLSNPSKVASVSITAACSGIESMMIFTALSVVMFMDVGRRAPKAKTIGYLLVGIAGVYLLEALRAPLVIIVGYSFGAGLMETFHLYSGALMFLSFMSAFWYIALKRLTPGRSGSTSLAEAPVA